MIILNEEVTGFINQYYEPLDEELGALRAYGEENIIPIILKETEIYLNTLLPIIKPRKILEVGTAIGYSSMYFAKMCPECEVFTIEKNEDVYETAKANIEKAGLSDRIHCFVGDGEEQIRAIGESGERDFDFVFIDAAKSHYRRFFEAAAELCAPNAVILSDNILQHGMTAVEEFLKYRKHRTNIRRMREYVEFICTDERYNTSLMSMGDGIALTILK